MFKKVNQLVLSGIFIALGIVFPMIFHLFGGAGPIFLPMHIPVLLGGFFLTPLYAMLVGAITPFLSSLLTGMPPAFPMMPIMMLELSVYGLGISVICKKISRNPWLALVPTMILGRLAAGLMVFILSSFFAAKLPSPYVFMTGAVVRGIPGIIIQLIFIPIIVLAIEKSNVFYKGDENRAIR